jgi:hypothetical protein
MNETTPFELPRTWSPELLAELQRAFPAEATDRGLTANLSGRLRFKGGRLQQEYEVVEQGYARTIDDRVITVGAAVKRFEWVDVPCVEEGADVRS